MSDKASTSSREGGLKEARRSKQSGVRRNRVITALDESKRHAATRRNSMKYAGIRAHRRARISFLRDRGRMVMGNLVSWRSFAYLSVVIIGMIATIVSKAEKVPAA